MQDKQRIAVIGASGLVGKAVTEALIKSCEYLLILGGYAVNAFMKNPSKLGINSTLCQLIKGDANDQPDIEQAIEGCIAVVVAINCPLDHENEMFTNVAQAISAACIQTGMKRIIYVAGIGKVSADGQVTADGQGRFAYESPNNAQIQFSPAKNHLAAFNIYMNAGLEITAICTSQINDVEQIGEYTVDVERVPEINKLQVGKREVADFILKEIKNPQYVGKRVSIFNSN